MAPTRSAPVLAAAVALVALVALSSTAQATTNEVEVSAGTLWAIQQLGSRLVKYCWRQSYGRGVGGTLGCSPGTQESGALCYPPCSDGYTGDGPVCWQNCPPGFTDTGADCLKPRAYGRGVGYISESECTRDNAIGCERNLLLWYPKCKEGFHNVGCCVCSPDCPDNMVDIGVSCQKASYGRGAGDVLSTCPSDEQKDAALCYPFCNDGFHGVGPVCWGNCGPMQPYNCGAGCATDLETCGSSIFAMVSSVFEMAADIVELAFTGGAADVAQAAIKDVIKSAIKGAIDAAEAEIESAIHQAAASKLKDAVQKSVDQMTSKYQSTLVPILTQKFGEAQAESMFHAAVLHVAYTAVSSDSYNIVDFIEDAAPFGIGGVIKAFDKPLCDASLPPQRCNELPAVCGKNGQCSGDWSCECDSGYYGSTCNSQTPGGASNANALAPLPASNDNDDDDDGMVDNQVAGARSSHGGSSLSAAATGGIVAGICAVVAAVVVTTIVVQRKRSLTSQPTGYELMTD